MLRHVEVVRRNYPLRTRLLFRYGIAMMKRVDHLFLRVRL